MEMTASSSNESVAAEPTTDLPSVTASKKHTKSLLTWSKLDMGVTKAPASSTLRRELELYMECLLYRELSVHCHGWPRIKQPTCP